MTEQYSQEQLEQLIAEIEQISSRQETQLDRAEVEQILQELGLPSELLDEGMAQLHRRQALQKEKRRKLLIGAGFTVILAGGITFSTVSFYNTQQALQQVSSVQSRITDADNQDQVLSVIERESAPMISYQVTLQNAPIGRKLSLGCDWINPDGQIVHQNRYETKRIDREVWDTYCRYSLATNATVGNWQVRMRLGDRVLSSTAFQVQ